MSTIVVVKKAGRTVIAADTMSSFGDTKVTSSHVSGRSKIFKCGRSFIGVLGASAHNNVFDSLIRKHASKMSFNSTGEIFETYLRLHPILKEQYYINVYEEERDVYESSQIEGLIANPYGIFGMYSWREVYEYERFWALGSGMEYALGAMHALYDSAEAPEEIAEAAVRASCEFDGWSGLPFTIHSVKMLKSPNKDGRRGRA